MTPVPYSFLALPTKREARRRVAPRSPRRRRAPYGLRVRRLRTAALPALGLPSTLAPGSPATLVWRREVAGYLTLTFGAVAPGTLVHVAFSETAEYLGVGGTSDWSRTYVTDDLQPTTGGTWVDRPTCVSPGVCADGYRAFRFARISVERGSARVVGAGVAPVTSPAPPAGCWASSDRELTRLWATAAYTARLMELPADPAVLGAGCPIPGGRGLVVVDGAKRDRCPWLGDLAVSGLSLLLADGAAGTAPVVNTLELFAASQSSDGYLSASPMATRPLFDYPAYWVLAVDDLMLYRGELVQVGAFWPVVVAVLDGWYPAHAAANGLLSDPFAPGDYAYIGRSGAVVAYYNALYARALEAGAQLADALGHPDAAARWRGRVVAMMAPFGATFWDAAAGAFLDAPDGPVVHPQDGNAFAILAGLATSSEAGSALRYLDGTTRLRYGNALADTDAMERRSVQRPGERLRLPVRRLLRCRGEVRGRRRSRRRSTSCGGHGGGCPAATGRRSAPAGRSTATRAPRRASRPAGRPGCCPPSRTTSSASARPGPASRPSTRSRTPSASPGRRGRCRRLPGRSCSASGGSRTATCCG